MTQRAVDKVTCHCRPRICVACKNWKHVVAILWSENWVETAWLQLLRALGCANFNGEELKRCYTGSPEPPWSDEDFDVRSFGGFSGGQRCSKSIKFFPCSGVEVARARFAWFRLVSLVADWYVQQILGSLGQSGRTRSFATKSEFGRHGFHYDCKTSLIVSMTSGRLTLCHLLGTTSWNVLPIQISRSVRGRRT